MKDARTISKFSFHASATLVMVALIVVETIAARGIARRLGFNTKDLGGIAGGLAMPNLFLARVLVDRCLKRFGLSRSGVVVENRRTSSFEGEGTPEEAVTLRYAPKLFLGLSVLFFGFLAFFLVLFLGRGPAAKGGQEDWAYLPWGIALSGSFGVLSAALPFLVVLRADERGVAGPGKWNGLRTKVVPWGDVASCEIVTVRDTFGDIFITYPRFLDASGKEHFPKLWQGLMYVAKPDRDRLLRLLKGRFPKLDVDPWEL